MLGIAAGVAYSTLAPSKQVNPFDIHPTVKEQLNEKPNW
jgi:hypothetical protein